MSEEINIIDTSTRKQKLLNFIKLNLTSILITIVSLILIIIIFFSYQIYKSNKHKNIAEQFNLAIVDYEKDKQKNINIMKQLIGKKDKTYSPLALYFIIDSQSNLPEKEINEYFDIVINELNLEKEIVNLNIFKKALYNAEFASEENMLAIVNPVINSESVWKSHVLYLMGEYFLHKSEKQKAKEFFLKILEINNPNPSIKLEVQRRLKRDLSE